jgi:8-oxo-dGTP pyrophosphatase MutT (NUDIX family)
MIQDQAIGAVVVYREKGKEPYFLLVQQKGNYWAFPKGHKEGNETDIETAKRELWEETSVTELEWQTEPTFHNHYHFEKEGQKYSKNNTYFLAFAAEKFASAPQPQFTHEILGGAWATYAEALKLINFPPFIKVLNEARQYLK